MKRINDEANQHLDKEDIRKLWVEAVENMVENAELRARIEFLERQIAVNAYGGLQLH